MSTSNSPKREPIGLIIPLMIGTVLLLACLGTVGGIGMFVLESAGMFSRWESLGTPPEKPTEIRAADVFVIVVATKEGRLYSCEHSGRQPKCWYPVSQIPSWLNSDISSTKSALTGQPPPPPPGTVVSQLHVVNNFGEMMSEAFYVILADGTVWMRNYALIGILQLLGNMLVGLIIGGMIGVPLAIVVALVRGSVVFVRRLRARQASNA